MALAQAGEWPDAISPRVSDLADPVGHRSTRPLPWADARVAPIEGELWLAVADGRLFALGGDGVAGEPVAVLPPGGFRPAHGSDPVYVTDAGAVGRWSPASGWRTAWSAGVPGRSLDAFGLAGERVLLSCTAWPDGMRLLDERRAALAWSSPRTASRLLAIDEVALAWRGGRLETIALADGRLVWRRDGVASAVALSDASAWIADDCGALIELSLDGGVEAARSPLPGGVPSFALATGGLLYVVGRPLDAIALDLTDGTRAVTRREYPAVRLDGLPRVVAVTRDSRLVLVTAHTVLELIPSRDDAVRELWRTEHLIVDAEADGALMAVIALADSGQRFLTLLG